MRTRSPAHPCISDALSIALGLVRLSGDSINHRPYRLLSRSHAPCPSCFGFCTDALDSTDAARSTQCPHSTLETQQAYPFRSNYCAATSNLGHSEPQPEPGTSNLEPFPWTFTTSRSQQLCQTPFVTLWYMTIRWCEDGA